jgi:uncharacterized membrane protein YsdA (DUF1294 family)
MPIHSMKEILRLPLVMLCLVVCDSVKADIYKCIDADGTFIYTDAGCPEGTREASRIPEAVSVETKKLKPIVPLEDRLNHLLEPARYRSLFSLNGVLGVYGVMSVACFIAYYRDKRKSIRRQWRTPEATLHLMELLGGWPGGLLAQLTLRHKTRKMTYQLTFWLIVLLHGVIWADILLDHRMSRAALGFI